MDRSPPEDFRCPISLEIMTEPVILWTGQTYDRQSIQRWLDSGHTTCPKTKQELNDDTRLVPNYALRSLIHNWAQVNGVELIKPSSSLIPNPSSRSSSSSRLLTHSSSFNDRAIITNSSSTAAAAVLSPRNRGRQKEAVESLVKKISSSWRLSSNNMEQLRDSVKELRILAKESKQSRALISEAGGVAKLLCLLKCSSSCSSSNLPSDDHEQLQAEIEENAVVALLNLSADDENKVGLVAEGAVDAIVHILTRESSSTDTKASAALAITSLAMVDVNKVIIGRHPEAVPALSRLLRSGSPRGKKDATIALYSLCLMPENRSRAVSAGVVAVLLAAPLEGEPALALLDVLSACDAGRAELRRKPSLVQVFVRFMARVNTVRTRESSAAVLCAMCGEDREWAALAREAGGLERAVEMTRTLPADSRAVRKANKVIQLVCSDSLI